MFDVMLFYRRSVGICAFAICVFLSGCCVVRPPEHVQDPTPIFVADYGVHTAVMLPCADGIYVEYSFGDWAYVMENREMPWNALAALVISQQSTLGRNFSTLAEGQQAPFTTRPAKRVYRIDVDKSKVQEVLDKIDARYQAGRGRPEYLVETGGYYVRDSHHYSLFNNCNALTADILRDTGCKVYGVPMLPKFYVIR